MDRRAGVILGAAVLLLMSSLILISPGASSGGTRLLVATIHPLADVVRQVAGDRFEVRCLLPPGASPHTYEVSTRNMTDVSRADAVFRIGLDLEMWVDGAVVPAMKKASPLVTVSEGIELVEMGEEEGDGEAGHEGHGHDAHGHHGRFNPHVWLDPVNGIQITEAVRDALSRIDPAGAEVYGANAGRYRSQLEKVDAEYRSAFETLRTKKFVAFHRAYDYLTRRYGLQVVGVIAQSPGKSPGARHIRLISDAIRSHGVSAVLVEPQFNAKIARTIAQDAGVEVVRVDPLGTDTDPDRDSYLKLLRYNLLQLKGAGGDR